MPLVLTTDTNPGSAEWAEASDFLSGLQPSIEGVSSLTPTPNAFPLDLFAGEAENAVVVPADGDWLVTLQTGVQQIGASGGTLLAASVFFQPTRNGSPVGFPKTEFMGLTTLAGTPQAVSQLSMLFRLSGLSEGDEIGMLWGFGGAQAATLSAGVGRVLSLTPTSM